MMEEEKLDLAVAVTAAVLAPSPVTWAVTGYKALRLMLPTSSRLADTAFQDTIADLASGKPPSQDSMRALAAGVTDEQQWAGQPPQMRPDYADIVVNIEAFGRAYSRARSHGKRKMLFNAFFRSFEPRFYKDGMNQHLMAIAEKLEYPEARFLAAKIREVKVLKQKNMNILPIVEVTLGSREYTLARKLEDLELVKLQAKGGGVEQNMIVFEIGEALMEFIWEDELGADAYEGWHGDPLLGGEGYVKWLALQEETGRDGEEYETWDLGVAP